MEARSSSKVKIYLPHSEFFTLTQETRSIQVNSPSSASSSSARFFNIPDIVNFKSYSNFKTGPCSPLNESSHHFHKFNSARRSPEPKRNSSTYQKVRSKFNPQHNWDVGYVAQKDTYATVDSVLHSFRKNYTKKPITVRPNRPTTGHGTRSLTKLTLTLDSDDTKLKSSRSRDDTIKEYYYRLMDGSKKTSGSHRLKTAASSRNRMKRNLKAKFFN